MVSKAKLFIVIMAYVTVFLDMVNNSIIYPVIPYLVKELHSTSMQEGILFSSYSVFQLISTFQPPTSLMI